MMPQRPDVNSMHHPRTARRAGPLLGLILLAAVDCSGSRERLPPGLVSAGDGELVEAFRQLHAPIYRVYSLGPDRDAIHDLLAASFAGRALTREYVEHYTTLVWMQREQTAIDVLQVNYEQVKVLERNRRKVEVDADWSVGGVVTHRNHQHARVNRYRAVYTLAQADDGLRIVETRVRNSERVGSLLAEDGSWAFDSLPTSGSGFMDPRELLKAGFGNEEQPVPPDDGAGGETP
jgi:hypothetical protein